MHLLFNGQLLKEDYLKLPLSNRAFQYNDGFFETLIIAHGKVRFWQDHQARIQEAATALRIELPDIFLQPSFPETLVALARQIECGDLARLKLKVWRSGEGLYTPQTNQADWLVTAQPGTVPNENPLEIGICKSVKTFPSSFSAFKGVNSPIYVLASLEKKERGLEDLLLLDPKGHVAELTYSNIFWCKDRTLYTPALETGCLNGVMRRNVIRWANAKGWQVQEGFYLPADLSQAVVVFSGNVTGLRAIHSLEGKELFVNVEFLDQLKKELL